VPASGRGHAAARPASVAGKTRSPASRCGDAGLLAVVILRGFRVLALPRKSLTRNGYRKYPLRLRRSQRRSDGLRRLCGPQAARPTGEARPRNVVHARLAHGVVVPVVVASVVTKVARDAEAGEENSRDDEQDPGDDHNPRCEPVQPIRFGWLSRWHCGVGGDRSRRGWCFRCFTHAEMMRGERIGCARCNL
jgi:hypothetical protein